MQRMLFLLSCLVLSTSIRADGPVDNQVDKVRPVPPEGIKIPDEVRTKLQAGVDTLAKEIAGLKTQWAKNPRNLGHIPDVQVFHDAIQFALKYNEFYEVKEFEAAEKQLLEAMERAKALKRGVTPWLEKSGLVVRGYKSKIDESIQPYGLVVPPGATINSSVPTRLDVWCHGRGEKLSEVAFIQQRMNSPGEFTPRSAIVLHPYGRYCCANKLAGEIDTFEAIEHIARDYAIDRDRIVMRGFSMGGAACWQFAVHYPDVWCAAAPGAGFSETPEFLKVFQKEEVKPTWFEQKLWRMYDCPGYALNLYNLPTVAYSGEIDSQKQAADVMEKALEPLGIPLVHIIGPKTPHRYEANAKTEINRRIDAIASAGRNRTPKQIKFETFTLRYNRSFWITVDSMLSHWEKAKVLAEAAEDEVEVYLENIDAVTIDLPAGQTLLDSAVKIKIAITTSNDDKITKLVTHPINSDRSYQVSLHRTSEGWKVGSIPNETLRKKPGLQGPIDDAFLDRFIMVKPTGKPLNEASGNWIQSEYQHALKHWRAQFRGEALIKDDSAITEADISNSNLILWGDPSSNAVLAKIADKLPISWKEGKIQIGEKSYPAESHVPVLIYPNPLNPNRYIVINSGFTFREFDYLNNARQIPKLPDFAVVDITTPRSSKWPGKIVDANFFDEKWAVPKSITQP
jgi:hypothetical protein